METIYTPSPYYLDHPNFPYPSQFCCTHNHKSNSPQITPTTQMPPSPPPYYGVSPNTGPHVFLNPKMIKTIGFFIYIEIIKGVRPFYFGLKLS